ncbi:MAG: DUF3080 family protein [Pseudomonadota bacterium]
MHAVLALLLGLLCACSQRNDPAETLADYNARLSRLLDSEAPPAAATRVPTWPMPQEALPVPAEVRFDLFGFPDAGRCGLLQEISESDDGMMRSRSPAQQLLQQMRLLRGLAQCAELTAGDLQGADVTRRAFAAAVRDALAQKRRDLPLFYWYSTFGSAEFREFFSVGVVPLRIGENTPAADAANAVSWLAALGRLRPEAPLPAAEAMDQHYYRLVGNKLGGRVWLSVDLAMRELDRASTLLEETSPERWCPGGVPGETAERLHDLYAAYYVKRLQPWLATTERSADMLADALERLWEAQQVGVPPEIARYRRSVWADEYGSLVRDYDLAIQRHARAWQALLAPCGLTLSAR